MPMKAKKSFMDGYKTYNPGKEGFGNPSQWKSAFNERMGYDEAREYAKTIQKEDMPVMDLLTRAKDLAELKSVYRSLMMIHHPDKGGNLQLAQKIVATYTLMAEKFGA